MAWLCFVLFCFYEPSYSICLGSFPQKYNIKVKGRCDLTDPSSLIHWTGKPVEQQLQSADELKDTEREAWEA